jgi:hypothetical protein
MFRYVQKNPKLTAQDRGLLKETAIDANGPGTILPDFHALLDYVIVNRPTVTKTHQLAMKDLVPLNEQMTRPLQHGLTRPLRCSAAPTPILWRLKTLFRENWWHFGDNSLYFKLKRVVLYRWVLYRTLLRKPTKNGLTATT